MQKADTIVVGGGVAGLAAAVALADKNRRVMLVERRQHLGGRTYSFRDDTTGDVVDNGQHIMMGCYTETLAYMHRIGSSELATLQPRLRIPFADVVTGRQSVLRSGLLPAPLHVFSGLLRLGSIPLKDRLLLSRVGVELLWTAPWKEYALGEMTVEYWLTGLGQSEVARKHLWDVIAIGSLNDHPGVVSALPFFRVLRAAFLRKRNNAYLLIPHAGLSDVFVHPAQRFIEDRGGEIRLGTAVDSVATSGGRVTAVTLTSGEELTAGSVILAVPQYAVPDVLPDREIVTRAAQLETSPIITINLWFDRRVMDEQLLALLNGRIQWVFNRSDLTGSTHPGQYLSCIISGARFHVEREKTELIAQAIQDLSAVLPRVKDAALTHALVLKEVRATFSPRPGSEAARPDTTTSYANLFLAGDWTNTGLPATIEGAILSGHRAADAALGSANGR